MQSVVIDVAASITISNWARSRYEAASALDEEHVEVRG